MKVAKFGGSSVAGAEQFKKVKAIVEADPERRVVVVSAAGKRNADDHKLTDLLYLCHAHLNYGVSCSDIFNTIEQRLTEIRDELGLSYDIESELKELERTLSKDTPVDLLVSRGEYFTSKLMAEYLGYTFVDAADCVIFSFDGSIDYERSYALIAEAAEKYGRIVIPGFYGRVSTGKIKVMTRGGSDITGSLAAVAVNADVYENWTDVSGILMADPRIVDNPKTIETITYRELRELSYMGATVLHEEAIFPVRFAGIPINIKNTNAPTDRGTMIVATTSEFSSDDVVTGIAGKKGFSVINIEKDLMNAEIGFGRKVLSVLEDFNIPFEHLPSGIDTMSVVVNTAYIDKIRDQIVRGICLKTTPDAVGIEDGLALIAIVGRGMARSKGTAARIFNAVSRAGINIRTIDQGSSELNIIIGVEEADYEKTVKAIYDEFIR